MRSGLPPGQIADRPHEALTGVTGRALMLEEVRALVGTKPTKPVPLHGVTILRDPSGPTQINHFG